MSGGIPERATFTGDAPTTEVEGDGPLINDRPALVAAQVRRWCGEAHGPVLTNDGAAEIACMLNYALLMSFMWNPEFAVQRNANPSMARMRSIANALTTLRDHLPRLLADTRAVRPGADLSLTESLLAAVNHHAALIECGATRQGRPRAPHNNLSINIGRKVAALWQAETGHEARKQACDAFVHFAMAWLGMPVSDDATIGRNRRRRAK